MSLTDDDKLWIATELHKFEERLDAKIDHVEISLNTRIDRVETSLNTRIDRVETSLNTKIDRVETSLNNKIEGVEISLNDKIERVETALLTEFHKWASPNEARQRTNTSAIRALELEFEALRERVEKLERPQ